MRPRDGRFVERESKMARRSARRTKTEDGPNTRVAIYVRVSTEEQTEGYSLSAQEHAAEAFCQGKGWEIVARYRDEGKSARTDVLTKRPEFARMLADAEAGRFDVIVVHKLDRFARNIRVTLDTLARLEAAGMAFVSISENIDFTTAIGRVILATLSAFAQYYSDNVATETAKGKQERKRQGLYNGVLPFGTIKGEDGIPVLDTAPHWQAPDGSSLSPADGLRLAFELAAEGKTHREIARALNVAGYRTTGNRGENAFTKDSVRVILANRFYVGELPDGAGGWMAGKQGALVDPDLFQRAQAMRDRNTYHPRRVSTVRTPWALSGVATCGDCGAPLVLFGAGPRRRVQCSGSRQGNGCEAPTFFVETVEEQIGRLLDGFAVPTEARAWLLTAWQRSRSRHIDANTERIRLRSKLARLSELYIEGMVERPAYDAQREAILGELANLPAATDPTDDAGRILADYLANVGHCWTAATAEERNQIARQLFTDVLVIDKATVAVMPRPEFRPFLELAQADAETCEDLSSVMSLRRKRRGSTQHLQNLLVGSVRVPVPDFRPTLAFTPRWSSGSRRDTRAPSRYCQRARRLTPDQEAAIRALAATKSLRSLAADFGVSHETIRCIIRGALDAARH
jgi:site-specific DNA recombinase